MNIPQTALIMELKLAVSDGPEKGKSFVISEHDLFLVGRSPEAHFSLPGDPYFSRNHFLIEFNPPQCKLTDLRSRNGTLVNGQKVNSPIPLKNGDKIRGGDTQLDVSLLDPYLTVMESPVTKVNPMVSQSQAKENSSSPATSVPAPVGHPRDNSANEFPIIPNYRIIDVVGKGGMGLVYRAERESDGLVVAIKTILPEVQTDEKNMARFLREASILQKLNHPNIVGFKEIGQTNGLIWLVMDYVSGSSLEKLVTNFPRQFPTGRAVRLVCQVLEGLAYAHGQGYVHRDIKPGNVLVHRDGENEQAKLADFGLARTYQASPISGLTLSGAVGGTPKFIPPEQILDFRSAKPPADQYSTAAMLYFLLSKEFPHSAPDLPGLLQKVLNEDVKSLRHYRPDLPAGLISSVDRALKRNPKERFASVEVFRQGLIPFQNQ